MPDDTIPRRDFLKGAGAAGTAAATALTGAIYRNAVTFAAFSVGTHRPIGWSR